MLDVFNIATPQGCNIQTFYGSGETSNSRQANIWNKPRGVSNVYMLLIGPGGDGNGTTGGGSGGVTVWYGSALNVPDTLNIRAGASIASTGTSTEVVYRTANTVNTLLKANAASGSTAGTAETAGVFAASGFYQSIAGQNGTSAAGISASSTTFLGGGCANGGAATGNYGYSNNAPGAGGSRDGFFIMQPIIVGVGGTAAARGGIGCGGGAQGGSLGVGGPGFALIASW
jgi:hypothetical protein